jgi:serine/threonine protein phosphatase 1
MRTIAVGDIHGQSESLKILLEAIQPTPEDVFVFLGDYIDRGPDSKAVVSQIIDLAQFCLVHPILGNHEEMFLGAWQGDKSDLAYWLKFGGKEALDSYGVNSPRDIPRDHIRFYGSLMDYYETDTHIYVHGWCLPDRSPKDTGSGILRWERLPVNPPPHESGKIVICGHTPQKKVLDLGHLYCLDTGSGIFPNGRITAMDVYGEKLWQVGNKSKKVVTSKL